MQTSLTNWSRIIFLAGLVLGLVLFIPIAWLPLALAKVAIFALCLLVAAILFAVGRGAREEASAHGLWAALLVALLPLVYLLSYFFSTDPSVGVSGFAIESDTL